VPTKNTLNPKFFKAVERLVLSGWTQEALARDKEGEPIDPCDPEACSWCIIGAVLKVADDWDIEPSPHRIFLDNLVRELDDSNLGRYTLARYNDQKELVDIKRFLRRAARKVARKP